MSIMKQIQTILTIVLCLLSLGLLNAGSIPPGTDYSRLNQGDPEKSYRERVFRAYLPIAEQCRRLKVGELDRFENATGIYYEPGEEATITLTGSQGQELRLVIYNSFRKEYYALKEGRNTITVKNPGLAYIDYRSMTPQEAPPIKVKIEGGKINGVMTLHDDTATWKRLLANTKCDVMDLIGERTHALYWVEGLRKGCPEKGPELIRLYDELVGYIQDDLLGFKRYKIHTGGHVLIHTTEKGYMSAGGDGVNLGIGVITSVSNVDGVLSNGWGLAHELGHIFQTRPGMKWAGMTETTNNIPAMYFSYKKHPHDMRLEHSAWPNSFGERMHGSVYDCYVNNAIVQRQIWQYYSGTLKKGLPNPWEYTTHNVTVNLVPLWQLLLYNMEALGKKGFYPHIYNDVRNTDESKMTQGELRVLFFKRACDAAKLDFSEYFVKTGMLVPLDREARDYSGHQMTITRKMCEQAIRYASRYPKPESRVIYYITADTMPIFRDKRPITPPRKSEVPSITNNRMEIPATMWKNAVAFEAYAGDKLLYVSLFSLNHEKKDATTVICPEGTDKVMAVQWDGTRYPVLTPRTAAQRPGEENLQEWFAPRGLGIRSLHEAAMYGSTEAFKARMEGPVPQYDPYGELQKMLPPSADNRPNVNLKNEQGDTPLHLAVANNHAKLVKALLKAGADISIKNEQGKTPGELARNKQIRALLETAAARREKEIALFPAIEAGDAEAIRKGMNEKLSPDAYSADGERTLLTEAVSRNKPEIARLLVESGANVNLAPPDGQTALHLAATAGSTELIDLLLKHGADPTLRAKNGATALLNTVWDKKLAAAKLLLPAYKSTNFSPERQGSYPICIAIQRNYVEFVRAFIDAGLDVNDTRFARTPLLVMAAKLNKPEIAALLLQAGAQKDAKDADGKTAADYAKGKLAELLK